MKKKITEKNLLLISLLLIISTFLIFYITGIFAKDKIAFEYTMSGLAALTIFLTFAFLYKYEFNSDYIWILILTAGILSVTYVHVNKTIFVNGLVDPSLFFTLNMSEYGVSLLEVVFLTVISVFVISAISEIKSASQTSKNVSEQNQTIFTNINNTIEQTNIAAQNAQKAAGLAKDTARIWERHNEITKILDEVEDTYFGMSFTSSLTKYLNSWKNLLMEFGKNNVTDAEKMIMAELISNYIDEEIKDFNKSTFASNFGLYAKNVEDIMNLFLIKEIKNG